MKLSIALLLVLACTFVTKAAPILPVPEPAAGSVLQDLTPRDMGWQGAPSKPVQPVINNNPWDKRDIGWQAVPSNPQEVNNPWDVVKPDSKFKDERGGDGESAEVDTNPWDKRGDDSAEVDTNPWD
ncbi:MAG: hypothetical protein JOS17DRAFT_762567 [Linnemannia elongata]|nr:MAG: hypothetical protein JOS17DRAFT_762567 [Linnemannia elongata]